jgi:hypothetical protein
MSTVRSVSGASPHAAPQPDVLGQVCDATGAEDEHRPVHDPACRLTWSGRPDQLERAVPREQVGRDHRDVDQQADPRGHVRGDVPDVCQVSLGDLVGQLLQQEEQHGDAERLDQGLGPPLALELSSADVEERRRYLQAIVLALLVRDIGEHEGPPHVPMTEIASA